MFQFLQTSGIVLIRLCFFVLSCFLIHSFLQFFLLRVSPFRPLQYTSPDKPQLHTIIRPGNSILVGSGSTFLRPEFFSEQKPTSWILSAESEGPIKTNIDVEHLLDDMGLRNYCSDSTEQTLLIDSTTPVKKAEKRNSFSNIHVQTEEDCLLQFLKSVNSQISNMIEKSTHVGRGGEPFRRRSETPAKGQAINFVVGDGKERESKQKRTKGEKEVFVRERRVIMDEGRKEEEEEEEEKENDEKEKDEQRREEKKDEKKEDEVRYEKLKPQKNRTKGKGKAEKETMMLTEKTE